MTLATAACGSHDCGWAKERTDYLATIGERVPAVGTCGDGFDFAPGQTFRFHTHDFSADCEMRAAATFTQVKVLGPTDPVATVGNVYIVLSPSVVQVRESCSGNLHPVITAGPETHFFRSFFSKDPESCVVPGSTITERANESGGACSDSWLVTITDPDGRVVADP